MCRRLLLALLLGSSPVALRAQPAFNPDTVQAGRLDGGKMWLFEDPPVEYLAGTYDFRPDEAWFERARMASLRMPGCSASFVSPHGLVATNHHCAQGSVIAVDRGEEGLLDAGFTARALAEERRVPDLYMDQLVAFADVTEEVNGVMEDGLDADSAGATVQARLLAERGGEDAGYVVQVVGLYHGGRYSAYTFRRHTDVRLVMAPEQALGFFGGDPDNFTYPRYALDFAFFRIYDADGEPMETAHYFPLSAEGVGPGELIFVIGNPGSTSRGLTVAQLELVRDVQGPATLEFLGNRLETLRAYLASGPENPDALRGQIFGLSNSQKAYRGRRDALADPYIIARRAAAERDFRRASAEAGAAIDEMAEVQSELRALAPQFRAFAFLYSPGYGSSLLRRAQVVHQAVAEGGEVEGLAEIQDRPAVVEQGYLTAEVESLRRYFAETDRALPEALDGPSAAAVAERLLATSALASAGSAAAFAASPSASGRNPSPDPAVQVAAAVADDLAAFRANMQALGQRQADLARRLGRARFGAYGVTVPPDATFSPRFTDGLVKGFEYNGTLAPPMTTLSGLYDRYFSFCVAAAMTPCEWKLPERWLDARDDLDLGTPANFVSTSDTIGGNSGSPALNRDLELVGLNFDRNIEGLVRDYIYLPDRGRNVMVDVRFILEALDDVYGLDALIAELTAGELRH